MTLDEALADVAIAFRHVEFSIKLLSHCERGKLDPAEFDTHQVVLLQHENLSFPHGNFSTQADLVREANITVLSALGISALTLDKAWEVAGFGPDPGSKDGTTRLRTLVYMVRCAYAHGISDPKWQAKNQFRRMLELDLPSGAITLDLGDLDGRGFEFDALGGHARWFEIHDISVTTLAAVNPQSC